MPSKPYRHAWTHSPLRISKDSRFLVQENGTPFTWMGDTVWELFHRGTREEVDTYLANRKAKGFTVVQTVALAEKNGTETPNRYGHLPLKDNDPTKPLTLPGEYDYWDHVDYVVDKAAELGMYVGFLPAWGRYVTMAQWEKKSAIIFDESNAATYGAWLGERYGNRPNIIWVLGGDRSPVEKDNSRDDRPVWASMARAIRDNCATRQLISFHPNGGASSSRYFHEEDWLDFNMLQSGHVGFDNGNSLLIDKDYANSLVKPVLDGEPKYENMPEGIRENHDRFGAFDVRVPAYQSLFAGAFGHTYGHHSMWQWANGDGTQYWSDEPHWDISMDHEGAHDMKHVVELLESRPFLKRKPCQELLAYNFSLDTNSPNYGKHMRATLGEGYAMVYTPQGDPITVKSSMVASGKLTSWWFDPRNGRAQPIREFTSNGEATFSPPGTPKRGNDWVLVIDEAARRFPAPGKALKQLPWQSLS